MHGKTGVKVVVGGLVGTQLLEIRATFARVRNWSKIELSIFKGTNKN